MPGGRNLDRSVDISSIHDLQRRIVGAIMTSCAALLIPCDEDEANLRTQHQNRFCDLGWFPGQAHQFDGDPIQLTFK